MSKKRRSFSAEFKAKVALEAIKEAETINQIASRHDVLPVQVSQWKKQLLESLPDAFGSERKRSQDNQDWERRESELFRKIGQLEMERDWLKKNMNSLVSCPEAKRSLIDKTLKMPVRRQCELLEMPRSSAYYKPTGVSAYELMLMRQIDEIYTHFPFFGSRQMVRMLRTIGHSVGRNRVRRLMRKMGLEALCPKPNLSKPAPGHKIYPYLMKSMNIDGPNQAWCVDITYIRLDGGFVYLVAIMDWYSRKILAWELSNSMDVNFCIKAMKRALASNPTPLVMNSDQGSQFTGQDWIGLLKQHRIQISMDGKGRALDNAFVERFWRSLKYEEVYRREYANYRDAQIHIQAYMQLYNYRRPHSALDGSTPAEIHHAHQKRAA